MAEPAGFEGLQRIDGVRALPPSGEAGGDGSLSEAAAARFAGEKLLADVADFCGSGWSFTTDPSQGYEVYKQADRLFVVGDTLNLKFTPETSPAEIEELLGRHNLQKKRSLGFAANLMTVRQRIKGGEDALALTRRLSNDPRVEFAEPVIVESMGGRGRRGSTEA